MRRDWSSIPPYRLETFGSLVLRGSDHSIAAADRRHQRRRLALLAVLASAGQRGRSRDQLLLLFWPDSTEKKARHSLDQLVYAIRRSVNDSLFSGIDPIRLDSAVISTDFAEFETLLANGRAEDAVALYRGPFLDGFFLSNNREFDDWVEAERRRLASGYLDALERLALNAENANDLNAAIRWRQQMVASDPLSTRFAVALAHSLARAGERAAALRFAEQFELKAKRELGPGILPDMKSLILSIEPQPASAIPPAPRASLIATEGAIEKPPVSGRQNLSRYGVVVASVATVATVLIVFLASASTDSAPGAAEPAISARASTQQNLQSVPRGTRNVAAYDFYLRGRDPVLLRNDSLAELGLGYFAKATAMDPTFAAAYAELSQMYMRLTQSSRRVSLSPSQLRDSAEVAARKAIALDSSLADGHVALGLISTHAVRNLALGQAELRRAIALNPRVPKAHEYLAIVQMYRGSRAEAVAEARWGVAIDPLSPTARATLGQILYVAGRCDDALPILDSLNAIKPPLLRVGITRALCLAEFGRWSDATEAVSHQAMRGQTRAMGVLGLVLAQSGRTDDAMRMRERLRTAARSRVAALFDVALVSFGLGDIDAAVADLDRSEQAGTLGYEIMGPAFHGLHNDPRFISIMRRRGIALQPAATIASR
ncbi:MAG TPA: BTAD domain-containing putative transcriptional regulator [Gemmatimonadaceae bacterium]|nr:BTAD domain-containing putative transcriptional regulator [Gemmatimonadaceae bacterium]